MRRSFQENRKASTSVQVHVQVHVEVQRRTTRLSLGFAYLGFWGGAAQHASLSRCFLPGLGESRVHSMPQLPWHSRTHRSCHPHHTLLQHCSCRQRRTVHPTTPSSAKLKVITVMDPCTCTMITSAQLNLPRLLSGLVPLPINFHVLIPLPLSPVPPTSPT